MNRRQFLGTSGAITAFSLSGCLDFEDDDRDERTPTSDELERITSPPHEINRPSRNQNQWREHYLGENIDESPSIEFNILNPISYQSSLVPRDDTSANNIFNSSLYRNANEISNKFDFTITNKNVNINDDYLLVVETGYMSSDITIQWSRFEQVEDNRFELHGYYTSPLEFEPELSVNRSVVSFRDDFDDIEINIFITISENHRIRFNTNEDEVVIQRFA